LGQKTSSRGSHSRSIDRAFPEPFCDLLGIKSDTGNAVGDTVAYPEANTNNGFAIDGTVTFEDQLKPFQQSYPVESFSFTQGSYNFNNSNSVLGIGPFAFGVPVPFSSWTFFLEDFSGNLLMDSIRYDVGESTDYGPAGSEQGRPGTWTEVVSTPSFTAHRNHRSGCPAIPPKLDTV
jgi:hypothetical protein